MRIFVYMKILTKLQMEEMIHLYTSGIEKNTRNLDKNTHHPEGCLLDEFYKVLNSPL